MKEYIFIEETVPKQTLIWLVKKQKSNGCFRRDEKHVDTAQEVRDSQGGFLPQFLCSASAAFPPLECIILGDATPSESAVVTGLSCVCHVCPLREHLSCFVNV